MDDMTGQIIVLFGAPTVGKDTVTRVLTARDSRYEHFIKHKRGAGSKHGYTMVTELQLQHLRGAGRVVSEVNRYGSTYAIERERLTESVLAGHRVLVHSAEPSEALALVELGAALVLLECSRETATSRLNQRDPNSVADRLEVWDLVASRLDALEPRSVMRLATDDLSPEEVADRVEQVVGVVGRTDD